MISTVIFRMEGGDKKSCEGATLANPYIQVGKIVM